MNRDTASSFLKMAIIFIKNYSILPYSKCKPVGNTTKYTISGSEINKAEFYSIDAE
jgi:hypothetical protein